VIVYVTVVPSFIEDELADTLYTGTIVADITL